MSYIAWFFFIVFMFSGTIFGKCIFQGIGERSAYAAIGFDAGYQKIMDKEKNVTKATHS